MQRLDRLGWTDGLSFVAYGRRFGIRTNTAAILSQLESMLPPGARRAECDTVDVLYSVRAGGTKRGTRVRQFNMAYGGILRIARGLELDRVLDDAEAHLHLTVAAEARNRVFVHAGVVEWGGRAILIPGTSRSGKTTLVEALLRAGATYYSDEYAVLDAAGRVHPFARPLRVRSGGAPGRGRKVDPLEFGARIGRRPVELGLVVVTQFDPGARWRPHRLDSGRGVLALMENAVQARTQPARVLRYLSGAVGAVPIVKGPRPDAGQIVTRVLELMESERPGRT
jgi:hypothetical protein